MLVLVGGPADSRCDCCCWERVVLDDPDGGVPELLDVLELTGDDTLVPRYPGALDASTCNGDSLSMKGDAVPCG